MNDTTIVTTVLGAFGAVVFAVAPRLSEELVRARARRLPSRISLRMEEEWLGELTAITSRPRKLAFAIALTLTRRQSFAAPGEDSMAEIHDRPTGGLTAAFNGRKTLLLLSTLLFAIAAYGASFLLPLRYASESLILAKPREVASTLVVDLIAGSVEDRLKSIEQTAMSRTNLVAILREFPQLNGRETWAMDRRVEELRKDIAITFTPSNGGARSSAHFRIRYIGSGPELAQKVATKLTILFLNKDSATREMQVEGTRDFLQRQLDSIGERITQKGHELARARAAHEPEAARLALDYELLVSTYRSVFAKHEDVEMTVALEREQKGDQFQVVDLASLGAPIVPNRLAISGIGAFAGVLISGTAIVGSNRRQRRALA